MAKQLAKGYLKQSPIGVQLPHKQKTIDYIPVDDLLYDPKNPRLPHTIINSSDEEAVINWMLKDASILELMGSIGLKDFFAAEPLLVVDAPDNKFFVVEGNRRLTAIKLLRNPKLAQKRVLAVKQISAESPIKPDEVPVIKYDNRNEILDYLGFKHITGVKPWPALAKAKYLQQLQPEYSHLPRLERYKALAKAIGSRSDYVRDLLSTVELYDKMAGKDFFKIEGLKEDTIDFGVYYNALKWGNIAKYIGVNETFANPNAKVNLNKLKDLATWISKKDENGQTILGESRNLSKLNQILGNEKSKEFLRVNGNLDDALMYTDEPSELVRKAIIESLEQLSFAKNNVELMENPSAEETDNLEAITTTADFIKDTFNKKIQVNKSR